MKRAAIFLAEGFEEVEALTPVDLLRRAGYDVTTISITDNPVVAGGHKIPVTADTTIEELINEDAFDIVILPGGMKGTQNLGASARVCEIIKRYDTNPDKYIAAICAAPTVFAANGLLKNKKALCYPSNDLIQKLAEGGAVLRDDYHQLSVIVDDHTITGKGAGTAIEFTLAIIATLDTVQAAEVVADNIVYTWNKELILGL